MPNATPSLDTIFSEAIELPDAAERDDYLARACGSDDALRRRVEALVAAHFRAGGSFLEQPVHGADATSAFGPASDETPAPEAGTAIGPYTLREQIGEGGMGLVFVAEQAHPVRRKVALKLIKPGMDSRQVVARFEAERQALALMDHPNIAKVLDAGTTPEGRPFFVMELVKGEPVTDYCDRNRLTLRQRLDLFLQVCQAVQHAHQKGVIHRDLKPSNVLIAVHDVAPVAKVIDFGIAKAVGQSLTDKTVYTAVAQFVGTPLYMSPEQAGQSSLDVDTRTDVYALGVLLYELLTGTTPIDPETFQKAGLDEVRRIIREDEPPRPSARMSTLKAAVLSTLADKRAADPRKLARQVRGELDWVVMKCLEKDRNRRYESASALAADVQRFLADEPVTACPPSAGYRLRKFARRNKAVLATTAAVALALVAGTAVSAWQAVRADEARRIADERLREESKAKAEADRQSQRAAENYRRARAAVKQMLTRVATDEVGRIPEMKEVRRKLLEDAVAFYTELLTIDPGDAEALFERGNVYGSLCRPEDAIRDYQAALAIDADRTGTALALAYKLFYDRADYRRTIEIATQATRSPDGHEGYYLIAYSHHHLGDRAASRAAMRKYWERTPLTANREAHTAWMYLLWEEPTAALPHAQRAVELDPGSGYAHYRLAYCLRAVGDDDGAFRAADAAIRLLDRPHENLLQWYVVRGDLHMRAGRTDLALADYTRGIENSVNGSWHIHKHRAVCNFRLANYNAALADVIRAIDLRPDDASNITWIGPADIAACPDPAFRRGMIEQAARAIELTKGSLDAYHARAELYEAMNEDAKAGDDWAAAIAAGKRRLAESEGMTGPTRDAAWKELAASQASLGHSLLKCKRYAQAEPLLRECLSVREKVLADSWLRFNATSLLGGALLGQKRYAEAEPLLLQGYEGMRQRASTIASEGGTRLAEAVERLVQLYEATNQPAKAAEWREKLPLATAPPPRFKRSP